MSLWRVESSSTTRSTEAQWYISWMTNDKTQGMKSAYELALERLEQRGIDRPREEALSDAEREQVAEVKRRAEAKTAELRILHQDRLAKLGDIAKRQEEEEDFQRERQRVEEDRDRKIQQIRSAE